MKKLRKSSLRNGEIIEVRKVESDTRVRKQLVKMDRESRVWHYCVKVERESDWKCGEKVIYK